jgi:C4-dicarboxylate-specific signal transduction histidine kinase
MGLIVGLVLEHRRRLHAEITSRTAIGKLGQMNRVATAGELSASIAHEVNQPLTAIINYAGAALRWLERPAPDLGEVRTSLEDIVSQGHRASEVIGNVRAMFNKGKEARAPLDINDLVHEVLRFVRIELQTQDITVQTGLTPQLPLVLGNKGQLQQVILNLVRNAADAMNAVPDRARVLRVNSAVHDPDSVLLSVEDSGTGIDPKDIERIFESFFTTKSGGMGMGLSICRSIIEAHKGRLWASAGIDRGSVLNVQLPAA